MSYTPEAYEQLLDIVGALLFLRYGRWPLDEAARREPYIANFVGPFLPQIEEVRERRIRGLS